MNNFLLRWSPHLTFIHSTISLARCTIENTIAFDNEPKTLNENSFQWSMWKKEEEKIPKMCHWMKIGQNTIQCVCIGHFGTPSHEQNQWKTFVLLNTFSIRVWSFVHVGIIFRPLLILISLDDDHHSKEIEIWSFFWLAKNELLIPPLSAIFSPCVWSPLSWKPFEKWKLIFSTEKYICLKIKSWHSKTHIIIDIDGTRHSTCWFGTCSFKNSIKLFTSLSNSSW